MRSLTHIGAVFANLNIKSLNFQNYMGPNVGKTAQTHVTVLKNRSFVVNLSQDIFKDYLYLKPLISGFFQKLHIIRALSSKPRE